MRAVLASTVRPRVGQSRSVLLHGYSGPIRRTVIPSVRRKLTICDAFAFLLAPVLTAAFVADITHKDRRRRKWEQMLAQVQQEIADLRDKELNAWEGLQLRSIRAGVYNQRRGYATTAGPAVLAVEDLDARTKSVTESDRANQALTNDINGELSSELRTLRRYENALATKVGLQLLVYICTGKNPTAKLNMDGFSQNMVVPDSMDALLKQLALVNNELYHLGPILSKSTVNLSAGGEDRRLLDAQISHLTWQCRTGDIGVSELIYGYTQAVMRSQTGPSLNVYQNLVETFSTHDADPLTAIAMFPYLKTRQVLADKHICNIILQYGKVKDPRRLDQFLRRLTEEDRSFKIANEWEMLIVNGIRVPAPINRHRRTLDALIRTALQGDQPHRARAWATLLLREKVSTKRLASLFNNFLTYYARHADWSYGQQWLYRTITWAALFAKEAPEMFQRLVFRMLDLCVSCDQSQEYIRILNAAVEAGLSVPPVDPTRPNAFSDQATKIRNDWMIQINERKASTRSIGTCVEAAMIFQSEIAKVNSSVSGFIGIEDITKLRSVIPISMERVAAEQNRATSVAKSSESYNFEPWSEVAYRVSPDDLLVSSSGIERTPVSSPHNIEDALKVTAKHIPNTATTDHGPQAQHQFRRIAEVLRTQNTDLLEKLGASEERERGLLQVAEQLKAQLNAIKPKSLEAVFVEQENKRIRLEMSSLSGFYLTALSEKEDAQKELATKQLQYEVAEKKLRAEMMEVRQQNESLQEKLQNTDAAHQKLMQATRAREGNYKKIIAMVEQRVDTLRAEVAELKLTKSPLHTKSLKEMRITSDRKGQHQSTIVEKERHSAISRHAGPRARNDTSQGVSESSFTFSPS